MSAPLTPRHSSRSVPKTSPMSPSPAAESSASQSACAATSPSEWPAQPSASTNSRHNSQHGLPAWIGCTSVPSPTRGRVKCSSRKRSSPTSCPSGRGGQDLIENDCRPVVVRVLGKRELTDQDLTRLGQHPLLACGQAPLLVPAPQVTDDLGHLVHVAGGQLLEVRLVPARPVGRLFGVRRAKHLEDLVQAFL